MRLYGTGEAARQLHIPIWRLQKYLDSPTFGLKVRRLGRGKGSRRAFSDNDLRWIATTHFLWVEGYRAEVIRRKLPKEMSFGADWPTMVRRYANPRDYL